MTTSKQTGCLFSPRSKMFPFDQLVCDELDSNMFFLGNRNNKHEALDVITEETNPINDTTSKESLKRHESHLSVIDEQEESELGTKKIRQTELEVDKTKKLKHQPNYVIDNTKTRIKKGTILSIGDQTIRQRAAGSPLIGNKQNSDAFGNQVTTDSHNLSPTSSMEVPSELMNDLQSYSRGSISLRAPCLSESTYQRPLPFDRTAQIMNDGVTKSESHLTQMFPQHVSVLKEHVGSTISRLQGGKHSDCETNDKVKCANETLDAAQDVLNRLVTMMRQMEPVDSGNVGGQGCQCQSTVLGYVKHLVNEINVRIVELQHVVDNQMSKTSDPKNGHFCNSRSNVQSEIDPKNRTCNNLINLNDNDFKNCCKRNYENNLRNANCRNQTNGCDKTFSDESSDAKTQELTRIVRKLHLSTWSSGGIMSQRTEEETIDHTSLGRSDISLLNHAKSSLFKPPFCATPNPPQPLTSFPLCTCANRHNRHAHFIYPHLMCNCNSMCHSHWKYLAPLLTTCCNYPQPVETQRSSSTCPSTPSISGTRLVVSKQCDNRLTPPETEDAIRCASQETLAFTPEVSNSCCTLPCGKPKSPLLQGVFTNGKGILVSANSKQSHRKVRRTTSGTLVIHECDLAQDEAVGPDPVTKRVSFMQEEKVLDLQDIDDYDAKNGKKMESPPS